MYGTVMRVLSRLHSNTMFFGLQLDDGHVLLIDLAYKLPAERTNDNEFTSDRTDAAYLV